MPTPRNCSRTVATAALVVAALAFPGRGEADTWHIGWPASVSVHSGDDCDLRMRVRAEGRTLKVESNGCYETDDAESDVVKLEAGRYFKAEERRWGRVRKAIEIRAGRDGVIERHYRVDGKETPFDAAAQDWMTDVLRTVVQYSGNGLEQHIARVLKRDGLDGALREIARTDSDYAQRRAYLILLRSEGTGPDLTERVAREAAGNISSDHEMAELLTEIARTADVTPAALVACAEAAQGVDSAYELRRSLAEITSQKTADAAVVEAVLRAAEGVDSAHERAELLCTVTEHSRLEPPVAPAYFEALRGVDSAYESARALAALLDRKDLDQDVLQRVAAAVADIDSDYHKGQVLEMLAHRFKLEGPARDAYLRAAKDIGSEYHRRQALEAVLDPGL